MAWVRFHRASDDGVAKSNRKREWAHQRGAGRASGTWQGTSLFRKTEVGVKIFLVLVELISAKKLNLRGNRVGGEGIVGGRNWILYFETWGNLLSYDHNQQCDTEQIS